MNRPASISALDDLIATLAIQIRAALELGCPEAAELLKMSRIALQMKRHGISDEELKAFCAAVARSLQVALSSRDEVAAHPSGGRRHSSS